MSATLFSACGSSDKPLDAPSAAESASQEEPQAPDESSEESGGEESSEEDSQEVDEAPSSAQEPVSQAATTGAATIRVVDANGNPVEGILIEKPDGTLVGLETTWRGEVVWENASAGTYQLTLMTTYGTQPTVVEEESTVSATPNPIRVPVTVTLDRFPAAVEVLWPHDNPMDAIPQTDKQLVLRFVDGSGNPVPDLTVSVTIRRGVGDDGDVIEEGLILRETNGEGKTVWNSPVTGVHTVYVSSGGDGKPYEITVPEGTGTTQIDLTW